MGLSDNIIKQFATGLAQNVLRDRIELTIETVDEFLKRNDQVQELFNMGMTEDQYKIFKKTFEEENPFAYVISKAAQITSKKHKPWLFGERRKKIKFEKFSNT